MDFPAKSEKEAPTPPQQPTLNTHGDWTSAACSKSPFGNPGERLFGSLCLMTEDGFSILDICVISLWDKTGILYSKADSQIVQAPEIPRGWRKKVLDYSKMPSAPLINAPPLLSPSWLVVTLCAAVPRGSASGQVCDRDASAPQVSDLETALDGRRDPGPVACRTGPSCCLAA